MTIIMEPLNTLQKLPYSLMTIGSSEFPGCRIKEEATGTEVLPMTNAEVSKFVDVFTNQIQEVLTKAQTRIKDYLEPMLTIGVDMLIEGKGDEATAMFAGTTATLLSEDEYLDLVSLCENFVQNFSSVFTQEQLEQEALLTVVGMYREATSAIREWKQNYIRASIIQRRVEKLELASTTDTSEQLDVVEEVK